MEINNDLRAARKRMQLEQGEKSYQEQQAELNRLIEAYAANSLKEGDLEELLHESVQRIDVFNDRVVISSTDEKFEFFRRCVCRQKGFSAHMAGKLRRHFIRILAENTLKKQ